MSQKQSTQQQSKGIRVFVYGTLKSGHSNYPYYLDRDDSTFLGRCFLEGKYAMVSFGGFPGVVDLSGDEHVPTTRVYGEVYRISEEILRDLDALEGNGHFFTRTKVQTPWKQAWIYCVPKAQLEELDTVPTTGSEQALAWNPNKAEVQYIRQTEDAA